MRARSKIMRYGALFLAAAIVAATAIAQESNSAAPDILTRIAYGQDAQLPPPPPIEKQLAARAANFTEVTLGKNMLEFASRFLNGKDQDEAATRKLIEGLQGIYVREYEFDKDGEYSVDDVEQLRKYFETSEWSPIVRERERRTRETTDVMIKLVNGETRGMFVLTAEPRELTIVLILGPVRMQDLSRLSGLSGLSALGDVDGAEHKDKSKTKKGDTQ